MRLRFVTGNDLISADIRAREGEMAAAIGFTPSHVELVWPGGYLGAHDVGGVAVRPVGYDRASLAHELFVDIDLADAAAADAWAAGKIGTPYDWAAIVDFVVPVDWHLKGHLICSAFATLYCVHGKFFPFALACEPHAMSPRDLLLAVSARAAV